MRRARFLLLALAASGCTMTGNPLDRAGTWRPTGANAANLAAEVADPQDLVAGRGTAETSAPLAVLPVKSLLSDKVKALPEDGIDALGGGGGQPAGNAPESGE